MQRESYYRYAREGYAFNEVVYACIEELATSAAEPRIAAYKKTSSGLEKLDSHMCIDLLEKPNPFMDGYELISTVMMHLSVAGNAYVGVERSAAGKIVELWPMRPDRMRVIPDKNDFIRGWQYIVGGETNEVPARDVIHIKYRNPLDDYYGMPPLAAAVPRIDTDNFMRAFTGAFFRNAGVPAGILKISKKATTAERELIQNRFRNETAGPGAWHNMLVLENMEVEYQALGMPLGERGLVLPSLDEIDESRIAMVFGVPLILIGSRLGMQRSTYANYTEARRSFWDETLRPIYRMISAKLTAHLVPEFKNIEAFDEIQFDLSTVGALQEDQDAKHTRVREDMKVGLLSLQEARKEIGRDPDYETGDIVVMVTNVEAMPADQLGEADAMQGQPNSGAEAAQAAQQQQQQNGTGNAQQNGHIPTAQEQFDALFPALRGT